MAKKNDLEAKSKNTAMVAYDYGDDAGAGYEHQTKADTTIPFIVILQANSPVVAEGDGDYKPGMYMNTVTGQTWDRDKGFLFLPATTRHYYAEWKPRDQGGGWQGHHTIDSQVVQDAIANAASFGKNKTPDGNDLTETFYVYGIICAEDGEPESMAAIAFASTKIKAYKTWMSRCQQFFIKAPNGKRIRPPLYAHLSRFTTTMKKNDKGQFYVPVISSADPRGMLESLIAPDDERFLIAKQCKELVDSDAAKIDPNQQSSGGEESSSSTPF